MGSAGTTRAILLAATASALSSLGAQAPVRAPDLRPTVAILYFNNGSMLRHADYDPLTKGISDLLITELAANPGVRVVERDQIQRLLDEIKLGSSDRVDPETAVRVGKLLGAHHVVLGGFVVDPRGRMRLDARAVRVETGVVEHVESVQDKSDDVLDMIAQLGRKLNKGMRLPSFPDVGEVPPTPRPGHRFQALMLYSRALAEEDRGNIRQATELYRAALAEIPGYGPAERRLNRLRRPA